MFIEKAIYRIKESSDQFEEMEISNRLSFLLQTMHKCSVLFIFSFYEIKIKWRIIKQQQTHNQTNWVSGFSYYSNNVFDKTNWVSGFIKEKAHKLTKTSQRSENNSHYSYTETTNKPALFWKQWRNYLSIECKRLIINPTSAASVFPRLYSYLHPNRNWICIQFQQTQMHQIPG
jgi:hypothetical protein